MPVLFRAIWWAVTQQNGASALSRQRILGLGSYEAAWTWRHKIRHARVTPGRAEVDGEVEGDETFPGGLAEGVNGRQSCKKALVVIAAQADGKRIGRIRMRRIPDAGGGPMDFIAASIAPGSLVHTEGWVGYAGLEERLTVNGYGIRICCRKRIT